MCMSVLCAFSTVKALYVTIQFRRMTRVIVRPQSRANASAWLLEYNRLVISQVHTFPLSEEVTSRAPAASNAAWRILCSVPDACGIPARSVQSSMFQT